MLILLNLQENAYTVNTLALIQHKEVFLSCERVVLEYQHKRSSYYKQNIMKLTPKRNESQGQTAVYL